MFYQQVKQLCDEYPIKITSLARKLNLSPSAPNLWQHGSLPKAETIMKISDFFDVSTDYLLYGKDRQSHNIGNANNCSTVMNQSTNNNVSITNNNENELKDFEAELIRIYRSVDFKNKADIIQFVLSIEKKSKNVE